MRRLYYSLAYLTLLGVPALMFSSVAKNSISFEAVLLTTLITLIVGGIFDIWAVRQNQKDKFFIWEYHQDSILGIKVYGVPIEDYVFFLILTPIFIISLYEGLQGIMKDYSSGPTLITTLLIVMVVAYTVVYIFSKQSRK